ncbi:DUF6069 family protein [Actinophytocola oryzae]|uniref:Putative secreted protein with PEP-CTERM sorting signal n=1 Tax=Actinophytocola oryzae TaxID=502181 RepID=A0A4R7VHL6_9PSEU|nr:DUF6069 family protein [Actinophytocola oryzae]TDV48645.1 putative secreted protein with PEP-CTERM sorting signal [Actinophytocola oryzae]
MPTKRPATVATAIVLAAACAALVNLGIATLARALVSVPRFVPLTPIAFVPYTVFGTAAGAIGWAVIRRGVDRPARLLRWLVPVVVLLSFVPPLVLSVVADVGAVPIVALMAMHLVVGTVAVSVYRRVLPLPAGPAPVPSAEPSAVVGAVSLGRSSSES